MANQVAGDIDNFTDKKQPWHFPAFHRLTGQFIGIYTARRHLSFFITLRALRDENPFMRLPIECYQCLIVPGYRCMQVNPTRGKAMRQESLESTADGGHISSRRF